MQLSNKAEKISIVTESHISHIDPEKVVKIDIVSERYEFAHMLRGIAAIIVTFGAHLMGVFWVNAPAAITPLGLGPNLPQVDLPLGIASLQTFDWLSFGHFGVAMFFLISGFVIPFSLFRYSPRQFLIARFFRIYPTYWIALTISVIVIVVLSGKGTWLSKTHLLSQYALVRDLLWLPSLDGISWTLEIEFKFYLVCALFSTAIMNARLKKFILLIFCCGLLSLLPVLNNFMRMGFPWFQIIHAIGFSFLFIIYMLIGILFSWHCQKQLSDKRFLISVCISFIWFSFMWYYNLHLGIQHSVGTLNFLLALLVFTLVYLCRKSISVPPILKWFGDISYPLYVIHPIVGYGLLYYFVYVLNMNSWISMILCSAIVLLLAYAIHRIIENPSNVFGKKLAKRF